MANRRKPTGRRRWARRLVFRLLAVMIALAPFFLAEVLFLALDWGRPRCDHDPFVGFRAVRPLFTAGDDGSRYEIATWRQKFFYPDSFAREKGVDEYRIFCLGGSTVQGRPFSIETSFTSWLELGLAAADPNRRWEVVNCGGVSYASYRLVPILEEVLEYEPDLIIVYTGHNEFLEDRTYRQVKRVPELVARPCQLVMQTRTYTLLRQGYLRLRGGDDRSPPEDRPILEVDTEAMLEYRGGLQQYKRDEKWRRDTIEHFGFNLRRMVEIARRADVPLILVNPVCNLRDCPPFKTQHRDGLTIDQQRRWEELVHSAGDFQGSELPKSIALLEQAMAIDDEHAGLHYILAKCQDDMGMTEEALQSYVRAKELDICPLRILEPMQQIIRDVAGRTDTPLVDVHRLYEETLRADIPGGYLLVDHVHPSIAGHQLIGNALADELARQGIVKPRSGWEERRDQAFREHLESLEDLYFSKGLERLEALRLWTQGKANRPRTTEQE